MPVANELHFCFTQEMIQTPITLEQLPNQKCANICGFVGANVALVEKLREIGFAEGDEVEILHRGVFGGSPLCLRLNRSLIALRTCEASQIQVIYRA